MTDKMWMLTARRQIHHSLAGPIFLILSTVLSVGCGDRETILVIEQPTEVHAITHASSSQDPSTNVQPGNVIATLKAGETAKAAGVYHGEDHDGFKVKLADGTEGLIMAGDTFKVVSR
ncbi:MAG: hypothetical protein A4E19_11655 [Nitrospira sp. SG-bin1]|nr:MAG: hypothetical protein A4E19_10005 [Nitrospira sp. SG-bin1]OQW38037.1 MAG: hypothetical protein A4E19_11655 [Nitrospira sp. SG-bin1]